MRLERALVLFLFALPVVNFALAVWSALRYQGMAFFLNLISFLASLGAAVAASHLLGERRRAANDQAARKQ